MLENALKTRLARGEVVLNGWLHIASGFSAELMARQGWDSLTLDVQHGPFDFSSAVSMIQAIQAAPARPLVRVPWNDPGTIMKFLDLGAEGIICPMVNARAECEAFVGACRYAPSGYRSFGPTRAALVHGAQYAAQANDFVLPMPMIETRQALEHLDEIAAVPGVGVLFVGPGDLGLSLYGQSVIDRADPEFLGILERIATTARAHGVAAGIFTASLEYARRMVDIGYQFVTVSSDSRLLAAAARAVVDGFRGSSNASSGKGGY